jgi:hypothetical protein
MIYKDIELSDKPLFEGYCNIVPNELSDYVFTTLFMWKDTYNIKYTIFKDWLVMRMALPMEKEIFLMPKGKGDIKEVMNFIEQQSKDMDIPFRIFAVSAVEKQVIEESMSQRYSITPCRDYFDYVYSVKDLISLSGKKYHGKKNHLNTFMANEGISYESISSENLDQVVQAEEEWCKKHDCGKGETELKSEKIAIFRALENFDKLGLTGGILKISGKIAGFTFAEPVSGDTVLIHIEKADPDTKGAYTAINQVFLEKQWKHMSYVNREEDLGLEGLRKAKESYHPVKMIEKYGCELKDKI